MKQHISPPPPVTITTPTNGTVTSSQVSRRAFLTRTATASLPLFFSAAPCPLRAGTAARPVPQRKIKLGIVGCGGRGCWIARLFKQHGGYDLFATADYFRPVAEACGDGLGVDKSRRFSGLSAYQKLLESGVEAVALETPPWFFPQHARAAVNAGMHVFMAKPVAVDVPGCLEIEGAAKAAQAQQRVFLVDYQIPTEPANIEVVKMVHAGEIGPLTALHSHYFAGQFSDPPLTETLESRLRSLVWVNDVALGGGYHVNACIHAIEAALWFAGKPPLSALGLSRAGRPNPHGDSHDVFELVFEFEGGLILNHRGKHLNNYLNFDVVCTAVGQSGHGQICYGGKAFLKGPENGYNADVPNPYEAGASRNIAAFHRCITEGDCGNDTVRRAVDSALTTILGREAGLRRNRLTLEQLIKENKRLELDLEGLQA